MNIHGITLNKKNFWIPFLVSSILSFFIFFFVYILLFSTGNGDIIWVIITILQGSVLVSFFVLIPPFFIIRRLLSKKPKKVFYFELPILIVIYSIIYIVNQIFGLMVGGPMGMTTSDILTLILPPIGFIITWLLLLTISLYFYYKRINFSKK